MYGVLVAKALKTENISFDVNPSLGFGGGGFLGGWLGLLRGGLLNPLLLE